MLTRLLERLGVKSQVAENGAVALEHLRTHAFDLVLMDVQMPVLDGHEATRRIRAGEAGALAHTVPIIAMTAEASREAQQACLEVGMNDYLTKPVRLDALRACLAERLSAPRQQEARA